MRIPNIIELVKKNKEGFLIVVIVSPIVYTILSLFVGKWHWESAIISVILAFFIYLTLKVIEKCRQKD